MRREVGIGRNGGKRKVPYKPEYKTIIFWESGKLVVTLI